MTSTLSDGAQLALMELKAPPGTPASSATLAQTLIGFSPRQIGAWMRELRNKGLVEAVNPETMEVYGRVPEGVRVVWRVTS